MDSQSVHDGNLTDCLAQSAQTTQTSITAFLAKLWALVNDISCNDLIAWDSSGSTFHVYDQARFAREILPRYFKHNNFASFIRQLNMYGFRKISNIEHGSLRNERDDIEFAHPYFLRGQESLLESIKRRAPDHQQKSTVSIGDQALKSSTALISQNNPDSKTSRPTEFTRLIEDVKNLQSKQTSLSDKLSYVQSENQALWSEIGSLRQKHVKQQQIVTKLMEFLVNLFTAHSHQTNGRSVEQPPSNDISMDRNFSSQSGSMPKTSSIIIGESVLQMAPLKRKQAALMLEEESNKRILLQHKIFGNKLNFDQNSRITIDEISDTDLNAWNQTTDNSPLIDLVPSPLPDHQEIEKAYQQTDHYQWQNHLDHINPPNQSFSSVDNQTGAYIPDFILRTDHQQNNQSNFVSANNGQHRAGIKTSQANGRVDQNGTQIIVKEEQIELPQTLSNSSIELISNYSENQHKNRYESSNPSVRLSVDEITGDVDHIQSSLDNIRNLMFESIPDDGSIGSLFGENDLLLPLLNPIDLPDQSALLDQRKLPVLQKDAALFDYQTNPPVLVPNSMIDAFKNSTLTSTVDDQLFEQFINESAKVEEQRQTINQLEREKSDLEAKVHHLEKRTTHNV